MAWADMWKTRPDRVAVVLLLMMVAGCSSGIMRSSKFEDTSDHFRRTMRWSTLEAAMAFCNQEKSVRRITGLNTLKRIKISSCELGKATYIDENKMQIRQIAEIQYYKIDDPVARTLSANLLWEYDPIQENWTIIDGWPEFK